MKKILIIVIISNVFIVNSYCDTIYIESNNEIITVIDNNEADYQTLINTVLENLDFSEVTSNLLVEKSLFFSNPGLYDGINDETNIVDYNTFQKLYLGFYYAAIDTNNRIEPFETIEDRITQHQLSGCIAIPVLNLNYHNFKAGAIDDYLIYFECDQLFDVPGRTESPYEENIICAADLCAKPFTLLQI